LEHDNVVHHHFSNSADLPFWTIAELGKGGFSYVDHVLSTISYREYARKLIPRGRTFRKDRDVLKEFEKELTILKKLSHGHIVELVGSYTDPR
jgi:serine/threonine protein kinase